MSLNKPRRYASIREAAAYANCHKDTIWNHIHSGDLTRYGSGRMTRVDLNEIDKWLAPTVVRQ